MSAEHASAPARDGPRGSSAPLRRDMEHRVVAGVLAGVANRLEVDPLLVRIGFVIVALLTAGAAIAAYVLAWIAIPKEGADEATGRRPRLTANTRVAAGVGFLTLALLLCLREIGLWWSDVVVWPLILAASGAALLWRQSRTIAGEEAGAAPTRLGDPPGRAERRAASPSRAARRRRRPLPRRVRRGADRRCRADRALGHGRAVRACRTR